MVILPFSNRPLIQRDIFVELNQLVFDPLNPSSQPMIQVAIKRINKTSGKNKHSSGHRRFPSTIS